MKAQAVTNSIEGIQNAIHNTRVVSAALEHEARVFFARSIFIRVPEVDAFIQREADTRELWYAESLTKRDCADCVAAGVRNWVDSLLPGESE